MIFAPVYYIPKGTKIIFINDVFAEDYLGGAELTFQAIIDKCPQKYFKIRSPLLNPDLIQQGKECYWILCNFSGVSRDTIIELVLSGVKYSIIECDYKYCRFRSKHLHKIQTKQKCDCHQTDQGRFVQGFFKRSQHVFFMSQGQLDEYYRLFPNMKNWGSENKLIVQGSTFDKETLDYLDDLYKNKKGHNNKWVVLGGGTWIKNQQETENFCKKNKIQYEIIGGMPYKQFVQKLSEYKGLVLRPAGYDTSPRITIEAKLLGLELNLNDNVQHKYDDWFNADRETLLETLKERPDNFWKSLKL